MVSAGIQRYMGDAPLKKSASLSDCVYELMLICHRFPPMRDEVFAQVAKQTTNNKSPRPDSPIKGPPQPQPQPWLSWGSEGMQAGGCSPS